MQKRKDLTYKVLLRASIEQKIIPAVTAIATEILMYVFCAPEKWEGLLIKSSLHRTYTQAGMREFNPYFVPNTPENTELVEECWQLTKFELLASQRNKDVQIDLRLPQIDTVYSWLYTIEQTNIGTMQHRWELRYKRQKK